MSIRNDDLDKAREVRDIIEKEFHKSPTVAELAQMVGTNKSTLNIAFQKFTGLSVKQYINFFRVEKAKELLDKTNLPIQVIGRRVGWHRSNLDGHFKKFTGKTPKEWRIVDD
jgi:YesN/AraC family two-component response regulator